MILIGQIFFSLLFILLIIYFIIPEILLHHLGIGAWKRQYSPGVCLTFDDGPDPNYTPRLLEILAQENCKACFFITGEKAEKYPELVKMIAEQGHIIGSHGYFHRHAWLMSPQNTFSSWDKSINVIKNITGTEPEFIRPPWGAATLALVIWRISRKKRIVSWNALGKDWLRALSPLVIMNKIIKNTSEGTIVLLHDSGGEQGAPENTLSCLQALCQKIKHDLKLPILPLTFPDWPLHRRLLFRIWESWEQLYAKLNHIQRINDHNLFRLSFSQYKGPNLINENGEILATRGDMVGEIHFDNIRFQSLGTNLQGIGVRALRQIRASLPDLAEHITNDPHNSQIKVYLGITLLNKGAKGLGFYVQDYPYTNGKLIGLFQKFIMLVYHPAGSKRKTKLLDKQPRLVWISKEKLIEKYKKVIY